MALERGRVVISKSGRDKDYYMVVVFSSDGFADVANGKLRRISQPKRKNAKHLALTNTLLDEAVFENDKRLREAIIKSFGAERR